MTPPPSPKSARLPEKLLGIAGEKLQNTIPIAVDISVTDYCNADCSFCGFRKSRMKNRPRHFLDYELFRKALRIFKNSGVSFVDFQGGEPLLHPDILQMIRDVRAAGMKPNLITNAWLLPKMADSLADARLHNLFISLDSDDLAIHEKNRQLKDVRLRIKEGIAIMKSRGVPVIASTTLSKLVDIPAFPKTLEALGFSGVTFSYPRQAAFGSSSLVFDETASSIDFTQPEFLARLEQIRALKSRFPVLNPKAGLSEIRRHVLGKTELYPCVGGWKYYYMDWDGKIWRCEAWSEPYAAIAKMAEDESLPVDQSRCTACMMACYRDTSALMYGPLTIGDALRCAGYGDWRNAWRILKRPQLLASLKSGAEDGWLLFKIFRQNRQRKAKK